MKEKIKCLKGHENEIETSLPTAPKGAIPPDLAIRVQCTEPGCDSGFNVWRAPAGGSGTVDHSQLEAPVISDEDVPPEN